MFDKERKGFESNTYKGKTAYQKKVYIEHKVKAARKMSARTMNQPAAVKDAKIKAKQDKFLFAHEQKMLSQRLQAIALTMKELKEERKAIVADLKKRKELKYAGKLKPVQLYALRLEDDCWYIGMSYNPDRRYKLHSTGKGALWTIKHKPIEIHEVRATKEMVQDKAARLEDDMTIEYALKYGSDKVRGGGYCQTTTTPAWPQIVIDNESKIEI